MSYPIYNEQDFLTHHLTTEEISNPHLVFNDVFDFDNLPGIRGLLWDWLKATVVGDYNRELNKRERSIIVFMYEKLQRMIEAAHIINEQYKTAKKQPDTINEEGANASTMAIAEETKTTPLHQIIQTTVEITGAEMIFLLNACKHDTSQQHQYDLLIVLPDNFNKNTGQCQTAIETACSTTGTVLAVFKKITEVEKIISVGHLFYSVLLTNANMIYNSGRSSLPELVAPDHEAAKLSADADLKNGFNKAQSFMAGAQYYASIKDNNMAAFHLHQAAEQILRTAIWVVRAQTLVSHNLIRLLQRCSCCIPAMANVFPQHTDKERELIKLLNNAYLLTRYSDNYKISDEEVQTLSARVELLCHIAEVFFIEKLALFGKNLAE